MVNDALFENQEWVSALIYNQSDPAVRVTNPRATGYIDDDDNEAHSIPADLSVQTNGSETGPANIVYLVTLDKQNDTGGGVSFSIAPNGGTATRGTDFTDYGTATITVPNGSKTGTYTVDVTDDSLFENNETAIAHISAPSDSAVYVRTADASATITDNDNTGVTATLSVVRDGDEHGPVGMMYRVTLSRTNATGQAITFSIDPAGGTATAVEDYEDFTHATISVPDNSPFGTLTISVVDDDLVEGDQTVIATISSPSNAAVTISTPSATAHILDDDDDTTPDTYDAYLSVVTHGQEAGPQAIHYTVYLSRQNQTGDDITFALNPVDGGTAVLGTDYADFRSATVTIPNGQSSGSVDVAVVDDLDFENNETVLAEISNAVPGTVNIARAQATAVIFDNDNGAGTIPVTLSVTRNGSENGTDIEYTLQASKVNHTQSAISFNINPVGGGATAGIDYTNFAGTIDIPIGSDTGTLTVHVIDDDRFQNDHYVTARISSPSDAAIDMTTSTIQAAAKITDNDNPYHGIGARLAVLQHGGESGPTAITYQVTIDETNYTGSSISFSITASGGEAIAGSDYIAFGSSTISVPSGSATGTFTVTVTDDALFENTEHLQLTAANPSDQAINLTAENESAVGNISDNDNGTASITATVVGSTGKEAASPTDIVYTVTLSKVNYSVNGDVSYLVNHIGGTAEAGDDYDNFTDGVVTIPFGSSFGTYTVHVRDDDLFENTETVQVGLTGPNDPALAAASGSGSILDNDNTANSIAASLSVLQDGKEQGTVPVIYQVQLAKVNHSTAAISFTIHPSDGRGTPGSDYENFSGYTISVPPESDTGTLEISVADDAYFEDTEDVEATITSPTDVAIYIASNQATATIEDNDNTPGSIDAVLSKESDGSETGPADVVFKVTLEKQNDTEHAIDFDIQPNGGTAIAGTDYQNFSGATISVAVGSSTGTLAVPVLQDTIFESTETVAAAISNPSHNAVRITGTTASADITDNDAVSASLSVQQDGNEQGPVSIIYRVTLSKTNNTGGDVHVHITDAGGTSAAGEDYAHFDDIVTIADGAATGDYPVAVIHDELFENTETLRATISDGSDALISIGTAQATANIADADNGTGSVHADLTVDTEGKETGPQNIVYKVQLDKVNNTHGPITMQIAVGGGTAAAGEDFTAPASTVTIADNTDSALVEVPVINDTLYENEETAPATISAVSDTAVGLRTPTATAHIEDNDNALISANLSATSGTEGGSPVVFTVTLDKANNTHGPVRFRIAPTTNGTAVVGDDFPDFTGWISVPDNAISGTVSVTPVNDTLLETTESVEAVISLPEDPATVIGATDTASADIADNDTATATLTATRNGDEASPTTAVRYTLALNKTNYTRQAITFDIAHTGGSAEVDLDYTFPETQVQIEADQSSVTFDLPVLEDTKFENDETVIATASHPSNAAVTIAAGSATGTIEDDDNGTNAYTATLVKTADGAETGPVGIGLRVDLNVRNETHRAITFNLAQTSGTATPGISNDYQAPTIISVADGATSGTVTLAVNDDTRFENDETAVLTISGSNDPAVAIPSGSESVAADITDNDNGTEAVTAALSVQTNGNEAGATTSIVYRVTLLVPNDTHANIDFPIYRIAGGTAQPNIDYTDFSGTITVAIGSQTGTYTVPVLQDVLFENNETVSAQIDEPVDPAIKVTGATASANIIDDDNSHVDATLAATRDGKESDLTTVQYTLTLAKTNNTGQAITFKINHTGGTAAAGSDYQDFLNSTITIGNTETSTTFTVPVLQDTLFENNEPLTATVSNASDPGIHLHTPSATAYIVDDDNGAGSYTATLTKTADGNEQGPVGIGLRVDMDKKNDTHGPVTFTIQHMSGTASSGSDYTAPTTISVPDGQTYGTLTLAVTNDTLFENNETATIQMTASADAAVVVDTDNDTVSATIEDNDNVGVTADLSRLADGTELNTVTAKYRVTLGKTNNTHGPITLHIARTGGSADPNVDFTDFDTTVTIADNAQTADFPVVVAQDSLFENSESIQATIDTPSTAAVTVRTATASTNIIDDDNGTGSVHADLTVDTEGKETGPQNIVYKVQLDKVNNTHGPITMQIAVGGGTAAAGEDFTAPASTVTIADNTDTALVEVPVINDTLYENEETAPATLSAVSDPAVGLRTPTATAHIEDNDNALISANLSATSGAEGGSPVIFTVTLDKANNTHGPVRFRIAPTTNGTAAVGDDFPDFTGWISVPDNAISGTVSVTPVNDTLLETTESVEAVISSPEDPATVIGATDTALTDIADNDTATATLTATREGDEEAPTTAVRYTLALNKTNYTRQAITFDIAHTGGSAEAASDYTFPETQVQIEADQSSVTFDLPVLEDTKFENDETVIVTASQPSNTAVTIATASATGTIKDDDNGTNAYTATLVKTADGAETGPVGIGLRVDLNVRNETHRAITFNLAQTSGTATPGISNDYQAPTIISVADGATSGTVTLAVNDDTRFENDETAVLTISGSNDPAVAISETDASVDATVTDNDNIAASVVAELTATGGNETGPASATFTVTLSKQNDTHDDITLHIARSGGTATVGSDYNAFDGSVTISPGEQTGSANVTVIDDTLFENTETIVADITLPSDPVVRVSLTNGTASADITDNDNGTGTITARLERTTDGDEEDAVSARYTLTLGKTNNTGQAITFAINHTGGTATAGSDYTWPATTIAVGDTEQIVTFDVPVIDDEDFENSETIIATISGASDQAIGITAPSATVSVLDNDNHTGSINAALTVDTNGEEDGPSGTVNVVYRVTIGTKNFTGHSIDFDFNPIGGTAQSGSDYNAFNPTTISVPVGEDYGTYAVTVVNDSLFENQETLVAQITNASDQAIDIGTASAQATIDDSDNTADSINADLSVSTHGKETGPQSIVYTVTLGKQNDTHSDISFAVASTGGTATVTSDYDDFDEQTIVVSSGSSTGSISVPVVDDTKFENTETVEATLQSATDAAIHLRNTTASANIEDNDNGTGAVHASIARKQDGYEQNTVPVEYTVSLTKQNDTQHAIEITINHTGGTAAAVDDYTFSSSTVSIPIGQSSAVISLPVIDDTRFENEESVVISLLDTNDDAVDIQTASANADILDNDNGTGAVDADLSVTTQGRETGPQAIVYTVTLSKANDTHGAISFDIRPTNGSAAAGTDYTNFPTGTISVDAGAQTGTFSVTVIDDALFENQETAEATISESSDSAVRIRTAAAEATIDDNDNVPDSINADLSVETDGDEHGPQAIVYKVTLAKRNDTHQQIDFQIDPSSGTADAGTDYTTFASGTITVPADSSTGTLSVPVVDDTLFENQETATATISLPSDSAIHIRTAAAEAKIDDNDNVADSINADLSVTTHGDEDGPQAIVYTVTLGTTNNTHQAISFTIDPDGGTAAAGTDYTNFAHGTITVDDNQTTGSLSIPVVDDNLFENTETATARISLPSDNAIHLRTASASANIADNDNGTGSIGAVLAASRDGDEEGPVSARFTLTMDKPNHTGGPISFNIARSGGSATPGDDFTAPAATASIADGDSSVVIDLPVVDDTYFENTEKIILTASSPSDQAVAVTAATAETDILDNDNTEGSIEADLSVLTNGSENGPQAVVYQVTLAKQNDTGQAITFPIHPSSGTAEADADYEDFAEAEISVAAGASTGTVTVAVTDDALFENTENVVAVIGDASDEAVLVRTASADASIADNDNAERSISAVLSVTTEGKETGPQAIAYTVTLGTSNETHHPLVFAIAPAGGTADAGDDYENFHNGTISVEHGHNTGTLSVNVVDDALFENTETAIARISSPTTPVLDPAINITGAEATAQIEDNDNGTGTVAANLSVTTHGDESGPQSIVYTLDLGTTNNTGHPITFHLEPTGGTASAGEDYTDFSATIQVEDNTQSATVTVPVVDDELFENQETAIATVSSPSDPAVAINTSEATATIADNDNVEGSITAVLSTETDGSESGPIAIVYQVTLDKVNHTGSPITFAINPAGGTATANSDYTNFAASHISVANGEDTSTFTVAVLDDSLFENTESVSAVISAASDPAILITAPSAGATITDDDNGAGSITAMLIPEPGNEAGPTALVFTLQLSETNNSADPLTFRIARAGGTAAPDADYTDFDGTVLSVEPGTSAAELTIPVLDDALFENTETVIASISEIDDPAVRATAQHYTGDLFDDEAVRDSDGDGILDGNECPGAESTCPDNDGDGLPNHLDADDDGDGIPTSLECSAHTHCLDTDSDSVPDYLEHNTQDTDGDGTSDHQDNDDDGDEVPTSTENQNPLVPVDDDHDGIPNYLDVESQGPQAGDSDQDGFPDSEECPRGYLCPDTDGNNSPDYMQPAGEVLRSPIYMIWNSFYDQVNVVVLANKSTESLEATVTILDIEGITLGRQVLTLAAGEEFDLIVNDVPGFSRDSYGLVRVEFDRQRALEGHSALYRFAPVEPGVNAERVEFALISPFSNTIKGSSYAFFDTMQPSRNPADEQNGIPHWVQIGNGASEPKSFTVKKYGQEGEILDTVRKTVPPQGRRDVEGGHVVPGAGKVGLIEIVPDDPEGEYIAQVFHYGENTPIYLMPQSFSFALGETARAGTARTQYLHVSSGRDALNWLALANTSASDENVHVQIFDNDGTVLYDAVRHLAGHSQQHILANDFLPDGHSGAAFITSLGGEEIIGNSRAYYLTSSGSVSAAYLSEARNLLGDRVAGVYNTYFEHLNWLRMFNVSASPLSLAIEAFDLHGNSIGTSLLELAPLHGLDAELAQSLDFALSGDSYGLVRVTPSKPAALFADLLRVKSDSRDGTVDLAKPLPLR